MTRVVAIILAAGFSQRFGETNKLLAALNDKPVIVHVLDRVASLPFCERYLVVNRDGAEVAALCDEILFTIVENRKAAAGLGRSISAGVKRAANADAALIVLGDMPLVTHETYMSLLSAFSENPNALIIAPTYEGRRGHPVLFAAPLFNALTQLNTDRGARRIIEQHKDSLVLVPVDDPGVHRDIDTPTDLKTMQAQECNR